MQVVCWDSVDDGDGLVSAEPAWIQLQAASVVTRWINATATQDQVASCLLPRGSLMQQKASGTGGASLAAWIMMGANSGRINTGDIKGPVASAESVVLGVGNPTNNTLDSSRCIMLPWLHGSADQHHRLLQTRQGVGIQQSRLLVFSAL